MTSVTTAGQPPARVAWLDTVRVLACFLVIICHCTDDYVAGPGVTATDTVAALVITGVRACVPLFVMISGALLLPMKGGAEAFLKRRFSRILAPFFIWGVILALLPLPGAESGWAPTNVLKRMTAEGHLPLKVYNIVMLPFNFTDTDIHFWFLYIIMGLYLLVPVISPWVKQATTRGLAAFLAVWSFTLFLPYIRHWPGHAIFPEIHGQCDWNTHEMTYYFGGYIGYFVLGHAMMRLPKSSGVKVPLLGAGMLAAGWATTYFGYLSTVSHRESQKALEFFIEFLSPNVALMTAGTFLICRSITLPAKAEKFLAHLSVLSFGIFLIHYWVLTWLRGRFPVDMLKTLSPGPAMFLLAILTFLGGWAIAKLVSLLPGKKWLLG